jgi:Domain of unknown function (DUF3472)
VLYQLSFSKIILFLELNYLGLTGHNSLVQNKSRIFLPIIFGLIFSFALACPAKAGQQQWGASYLDWSGSRLDTNSTISQIIQPLEISPATYWEAGWGWGYGGIQTGGRLVDGTMYSNGIFSIWNSLEAIPGPGSTCLVFGGEGTGHSCRIPIKIIAGNKYEFSIGVDSARGSQWWKASITDIATGMLYELGTIKSSSQAASSSSWNNFIEYFGEAVPCDQVGPASAKFFSPKSTDASVEISSPIFSRPQNPCVMSAGDTPPNGTIGDAIIRFGGSYQSPSTQTMPYSLTKVQAAAADQAAADKAAADQAAADKAAAYKAAAAMKKKTTITCIKGKNVKKVSAVSPICPAGYKQK